MIRMRSKIAALVLACLTAACGPADKPPDGSTQTDQPPAATNPDIPDERGVVLFLGTSLTAGYGIGADVAYPEIIQQKIDSAGLPFRVVNGGISGETSAGGLARLDWMLQQPIDVLFLELGANDGLRGYDIDELRANLDAIIRHTREVYPDAAIVLAGMEAPPNMGEGYTRRFRDTFRQLARTHDLPLVPFLLEGVAAETDLNIEDGIHPNAEGHRRIAETVWEVLAPVLHERASAVPAGER